MEGDAQKKLSCTEGAQAAALLFALNTDRADILRMGAAADIFQNVPALDLPLVRERLLEEWRAFVHAAVVYGLMHRAPNAVVAKYLRSTRELLGELGYADAAAVDAFIDTAFSGYMECLAQERQKDCAVLFFQRVLGVDTTHGAPPKAVAVVSGLMAMLLCTVIDKLDGYDMQAK